VYTIRPVPKPILIAHQAGNSASGMRAAAQAEADWIELDIWWQNGRLVARHERRLWRLPVLYDKWCLRLALHSLCLEEICALSEDGPRLLLDLKGSDTRLPRDALRILRTRHALGRAALCSQNWSLLDRAIGIEPALEVLYSLETARQFAALRERSAGENSIGAVSCQERLLTRDAIDWMQARNVAIFAWTVNDSARAWQLAELGVAGIISDRLDVLASLRNASVGQAGLCSVGCEAREEP
jgi:glycerophosphoryl diester phosphodiesterase